MKETNYYVIKKKAVPEVLLKVLEVQKLLDSKRAVSVLESKGAKGKRKGEGQGQEQEKGRVGEKKKGPPGRAFVWAAPLAVGGKWAQKNAAPAIAGTAPLVDDEGLEPPTSCTSSRHSTS